MKKVFSTILLVIFVFMSINVYNFNKVLAKPLNIPIKNNKVYISTKKVVLSSKKIFRKRLKRLILVIKQSSDKTFKFLWLLRNISVRE